jgi:RNA polymerase sigma-70 factor (ECF subfamily)
MDASVTIRLPPLPKSEEKKEPTLMAPSTRGDQQAEASDEALMVQLGEGSREALTVLFRRYARAVRSIAYRAVRDGSEADDLVQDIFLLVYRDANAFDREKGSARTWILQIAHRRAISRHRYLMSRHFYNRVDVEDMGIELEDLRAGGTQNGNPIEGMFGKAGFKRVFEGLSSNQRETLRLHFFEGYSVAEIATKLGQSRGNIKHHYFRGIEKLRKQLFPGKMQASARRS